MSEPNDKLDQIMTELGLSCDDVAQVLNVPVTQVQAWLAVDGAQRLPMPESELRLLSYSLMTENRRYQLF